MCNQRFFDELLHSDDRNRSDAMRRLDISDESAIATYMIDRLASPDSDVRSAALNALERLGDECTVGQLIDSLRKRDAGARYSASARWAKSAETPRYGRWATLSATGMTMYATQWCRLSKRSVARRPCHT